MSITADLERAYPGKRRARCACRAARRVVFGPVRPALFILLAAVALVLLVACVNVANLLLARASARAQDAAVRCALGATHGATRPAGACRNDAADHGGGCPGSRTRVCRCSRARRDGARRCSAPFAGHDQHPGPAHRRSRWPCSSGSRSGSCRCSRLAGSICSRRSPTARTARLQDLPRGRIRSALVIVELALAVVLVSGAALLIRSFWSLQQVNPGFQAEGVLKAEYQLPASRYPVDFRRWPDFKEQHAFNAALLARAAALPGVRVGGHRRQSSTRSWVHQLVHRSSAAKRRRARGRRSRSGASARPTSHTVGLELIRGRFFTDGDSTTATPVALMNAAAARRFFQDREPVGAQIRFWGTARTIVGVVGDEKFHGLTEASPIAVYTPLAQTPSANGAGVLLVRTTGDPRSLSQSVIGAIHDVDRGLAVFGVEPLPVTLSRSIGQRRFTMLLLGLFAARCTRAGCHRHSRRAELRRFAAPPRNRYPHGAWRPRDPISSSLVVRQGIRLAAIGLAGGLAGALALSRLLTTQLFGVTPTDPATYASVAVVLFVVALAATAAPARRAASVDPIVSLRSE